MPLKILIADDEESIRLFIKEYLESDGYFVIEANDGKEALSLVKQYKPHLLISDIQMPKKDGFSLVKELRKISQFRLLPVIFLTQRNTTEARIHGYEVGCDVYLPKPFEIKELHSIINYLLERAEITQSEMWFSESKNEEEIKKMHQSYSLNLLRLTKREKEVLDLISLGFSNVKIANKLYLSHKTIEKHVTNLLRKTNTINRTELVRFALDNNLVV